MRFLVTLLIPSLFVDKADSEFSFIPRQNLYPCASYSPGVRSQKYSPPPLPSIPLASYHSPFSFDHGIKQNRKTHIGFRGHRKDLEDPPKHESRDLSENEFLFEGCITAWISSH
ncbi:hypothetical protein Lal_00033180 [Lupinus albus]|nr:hypothetical protein Lal_00033180 [Lupinus albus]